MERQLLNTVTARRIKRFRLYEVRLPLGMMKCLLGLCLLLSIYSVAQTPKRGLILPVADSLLYEEDYCCILSPNKGWTAYDAPNGKPVGTLKRWGNKAKDDQVPFAIYLVAGKQKTRITKYQEIEYELYALQYNDSNKGFIQVADSLQSFWLNVAELQQTGFHALGWMDWMIRQSEKDLHFMAKEPGLRLRKEPHTTGEIIGSVRGDLFQIKLTRESQGVWNKVKVMKLKRDPCESGMDDNIDFEWEGWLKVLDDNGEPNLWRYTRGC